MADITATVLAFNNNGGLGVNCPASQVSAQYLIPRGGPFPSICITNYGSNPAFYRLGASGVLATNNCQCVLNGTQTVWSLPFISQSDMYIAVVCESGLTTSLQVTMGIGN